MQRDTTAEPTAGEALAQHGQIFPPRGGPEPSVAPDNRPAEDRVISVSPERFRQALSAEQILEQRRKKNREYQQRWRENHPKEHRDKVRDWEQSDQGKKTKAAYMRAWRKRRTTPPA